LVRAGFPVPPGFVVTTPAYDRFVAEGGLRQTIARGLDEHPASGAGIRDAFEASPVPREVAETILAAYQQLGEGPVAVRSSATAEDLPEAAFAGQQDTFLNVIGAEALLEAVRRCWASLWTDRAIAYRARQGIEQQSVSLAVVVQRMVPAEVAGVLLTANPVTGARNETVIDANPGLGEAVVSGAVTPDHFVLRRRWWGRSIIERRAGRREVVVRSRAEGGTESIAAEAGTQPDAGSGGTPGRGWAPSLPDRALRRLARLGRAIQRHFGAPQDVEWAWAAGEPFIVQSRPITALPEPAPRLDRLRQTLLAMAGELVPARPYPLDQTTWAPALFGGAVGWFLRPLGLAARPIDEVFTEQDGVVIQLSGRSPIRLTPGLLLAPLRLLQLAWRYNPLHWRSDPLLSQALARAGVLEARDPQSLSWEELLAAVREALLLPIALAGEPRRRYFPRAALAAGLLRLVLGLLGRVDRFGALLSGVETRTLEANRALEEPAAQIRSDSVLMDTFSGHRAGELLAALDAHPSGRAFLAELRHFLDRYGHREAVITSVFQPTWKDAPEVPLGIPKGLVLAPPPPPRSGPPAWEAARDEMLAHPLLRLRPLRAAFLKWLAEARCLMQIREDTHFYATRALPILRRALMEFGRRLVDAGVLDAPADVFHLKMGELEQVDGTWPPPPPLAGELRSVAAQRKSQRAALEATPLVDSRLLRRALPVPGALWAGRGNVLLRGTPGSPGVAEGPVRVIRGGAEFGKLRPGEVLVAPLTYPAWTPLFQRAAAVVVDSGGAASHAAIVAREYGIPAVMATIDGTARLADGQRVRVDGEQGLVLEIASPDDCPLGAAGAARGSRRHPPEMGIKQECQRT
jgi:pyruvate,water dikinase